MTISFDASYHSFHPSLSLSLFTSRAISSHWKSFAFLPSRFTGLRVDHSPLFLHSRFSSISSQTHHHSIPWKWGRDERAHFTFNNDDTLQIFFFSSHLYCFNSCQLFFYQQDSFPACICFLYLLSLSQLSLFSFLIVGIKLEKCSLFKRWSDVICGRKWMPLLFFLVS